MLDLTLEEIFFVNTFGDVPSGGLLWLLIFDELTVNYKKLIFVLFSILEPVMDQKLGRLRSQDGGLCEAQADELPQFRRPLKDFLNFGRGILYDFLNSIFPAGVVEVWRIPLKQLHNEDSK